MKNTKKREVKLNFTLPEPKELLEAGVHFGHETKRWNPKMDEYIYAKKGSIHIIDLAQTLEKLEEALKFLKSAARRGDVVFVGTKRQACDIVEEEALRAGAHYVVNRWAGGLLTNHTVLKKSLRAFTKLEKRLAAGVENRTKQEISWMQRDFERFVRLYEGVKHLSSKPRAVVVVDAKRERIAVKEARKANIPVVALADTNVDPDLIDYIIPGNDDAISSISLIMKLIAKAVAEGNKGKGVAAVRKNYAARLESIKKKAAAERRKKRMEKELERKRMQKLKESSVLRISEKSKKVEEKDETVAKKESKKDKGSEKKKPSVKKTKKKASKETSEKEQSLEELDLSSRVQTALESADIGYEKVLTMSAEDLKDINGIGPKSVEEIMDAIAKVEK